MMDKAAYIRLVDAIQRHDAIISRIRDVSQQLAKEVEDDFGGIAIIPETPLRAAFIGLIEECANDKYKTTSYLIEEVLHMKDGGSMTWPTGDEIKITDAASAWDAIQRDNLD